MNERVTELEIRLTHMEDTIDVLNRAVIDQHTLIDVLEQKVAMLEKKLKAAQQSNIAHESEETPPPHY